MWRRILITLLVLLILGGLGYTLYFLWQQSQPQPEPVQLVSPEIRSLENSMLFSGSVEPEEEVSVKSQIPGIIEEFFVEAGDAVDRGAPIARLRLIPDMNQLNDAEYEVKEAEIRLEQAEIERDRQQKLHDDQSLPLAELQQAEFEVRLAKQALAQAKSNLRLLKEGRASDQSAKYNIITSTASGTVLDLPEEKGTFVIASNNFNEGTTLANVANLGNMIFLGKANEADVGMLRVGQPIELIVGALPRDTFQGRLYHISPKGQLLEGNIQFDVKARLDLAENHPLRAGYSANARVLMDQRKNVLTIPESSIVRKNGQDSVDVLVQESPQQFERRAVELGLSDDLYVEVRSGVSRTDRLKVQPIASGGPGGRR